MKRLNYTVKGKIYVLNYGDGKFIYTTTKGRKFSTVTLARGPRTLHEKISVYRAVDTNTRERVKIPWFQNDNFGMLSVSKQ